MNISDPGLREKATWTLVEQASIFDGQANIYAPLYRQNNVKINPLMLTDAEPLNCGELYTGKRLRIMQEIDTLLMLRHPTFPLEKWLSGRASLTVSRAGIIDPKKGGSFAYNGAVNPAKKYSE